MIFASVVFPAALGPTKPVIRRGPMLRDKSSRTRSVPNVFVMWRASIT
jgi:hypothetical protein